jgi:Excreted virulence factor EspC, type VII ESX diderm
VPPTAQQVQVATDALRSEAGIWDAQADQLGNIQSKVSGLTFSRLEAGIFQILVSVNDDLVNHASTRCGEGKTQMSSIASTLRSAADTYDTEERSNEHSFRNLY